MKHLLYLIAALLPCMAMAQTVKSPDGNVVLTFKLDQGKPTYSMTYKGKDVVKPSRLGFELAKDKHASRGGDETDLMDGFAFVRAKESTFDETWKPVWGETATIRNHYNELAVDLLQEATNRKMTNGSHRYESMNPFPMTPTWSFNLPTPSSTVAGFSMGSKEG